MDKYLGCKHTIKNQRVKFDMSEYLKAAFDEFVQKTGIHPRPAMTPYAPDLPRLQTDELIAKPGIYAKDAAHYLMRLMFAARMACPNLSLAIQRLACQITKWSADCDRRLVRLFGYIGAHYKECLYGAVQGNTCRIVAWPDADLAGDPLTSRSTSGWFVEIETDEHFRFPISWGSKRQTSTSNHTCEAETVSLSSCVRQQGIPVQLLMRYLLGHPIDLIVKEDNSATIAAITKGYSPALRYIRRTHRIDIGFLHEVFKEENAALKKAATADHRGDMFTKPLNQSQFINALWLIQFGEFNIG
jgi:hypothetical protein